jgi:CRISPR-associated protein Cmr2
LPEAAAPVIGYVFSLGLVPVQEWIAESRRSRDLKAGSAFLAHVMWRLLARLEREGATLWLPGPPAEGFQKDAPASFAEALERYGIPNRASGRIGATDPGQVRSLFGSLEREVVETAWSELRSRALEQDLPRLAAEVWPHLGPHVRRYVERVPAGEDCPLTLVWVAAPMPGDTGAGARREALERIDRLYSEVKRTRPVRPWRQGSAAGKCNQCGKREAIGPESFDAWRDWSGKLAEQGWIERGVRIDPGERLCGVCLVKRLAGYAGGRKRFPSTGEIAVAPWLAQVEAREEIRALLDRLRSTKFGGEDLGRALLEPEASLAKAEGGDEAIAARKALFEKLRKEAAGGDPKREPIPRRPPSYLALLTFDGDSMGKWVRQAPDLMPERLARFAQSARRILEKVAVFYLAGDEGLAMVPAAWALDLALDLREAFRRELRGAEGEPTLSAGVAFFEYSRPLRGAIEAARGALQQAKELEGKDGLAAAVETASGNRWGFAAHWGEDWQRVRNAVDLIRCRRLSSGWAHDVESFLETIPERSWRAPVAAAVREEVRRLFFRRLEPEGRTPEDRRASRHKAWNDLPGETWWPEDGRGQVEKPRPEQLHLISFLSRQAAVEPRAGT